MQWVRGNILRGDYKSMKCDVSFSQGSVLGELNMFLKCVKCSSCLGPNKHNKSSAVAEMGDRLATIGMGRKWGGAAVGGWVPI